MNALPVGSRSRARRGLTRIGAVAALAAVATSGCAAGQLAQTANEKSSIDGVNATVGKIDLRALAVEAPPNGAGNFYRPGTDAALTVVFVNNGTSADALTSISTSAAQRWAAYSSPADAQAVQDSALNALGKPTLPTDSSTSTEPSEPTGSVSTPPALPTGRQRVTLPTADRVGFGVPSATGGLLLQSITRRVYPGTTIRITFRFAHAGTITVAVPVALATNASSNETVGGPTPIRSDNN